MSLIVEDGSGMTTAESLCSVAYATTYHSARGNAAWALLSNAAMEQSLRKATDYMQQAYRTRWKGDRVYPSTQALDWPRYDVWVDTYHYIENNVVPNDIQAACAELALKSSSESLAPDIERETSSETVGSLSVSYFQGSAQYKQFRVIDLILKPYLAGGGSTIKAVRA